MHVRNAATALSEMCGPHAPRCHDLPMRLRRTWQAFTGWPQYVMLAGASVTMLFAEVVAFEAIILMAGYLPQPAAQVCLSSPIEDPESHGAWHQGMFC